MSAAVLRAGFLTSVQDLGRTGRRASGVSLSGALDPHALKVANLLVGNEPSAAGLEVNHGKVRLRFDDDRLIAWCGGAFEVRIGEIELPSGHVASVRAGEELQIAAAAGRGARAWLAISGGVDVPVVLGSRSTDLRSGFGGFDGRALRDGDVLKFGPLSSRAANILQKLRNSRVGSWAAPNEWSSPSTSHGILRIILRENDLNPILLEESFTVASDSDRMGIRLEGPTLTSAPAKNLLSEAVAPGTIQLPPGGQPILLLRDCQTIGGYPKIAHVITVDLAAAAQLRPDDSVRFAKASLADAQQAFIEREREVARFRIGLELQTA